MVLTHLDLRAAPFLLSYCSYHSKQYSPGAQYSFESSVCKFIYIYHALSAKQQSLCGDSSSPFAVFHSAPRNHDLHKKHIPRKPIYDGICHFSFLLLKCVYVNISHSTLLRNVCGEVKHPPYPYPPSLFLGLKVKWKMVWLQRRVKTEFWPLEFAGEGMDGEEEVETKMKKTTFGSSRGWRGGMMTWVYVVLYRWCF